MKLRKYVVLDKDNKELQRGKIAQKDRRAHIRKGNTVQSLTDYALQQQRKPDEKAT